MGSAYGLQSPVLTYSPTLYLEATLPAGGELVLLDEAKERAVYVVAGSVAIGADVYAEGTLAVLREGATAPLKAADRDARHRRRRLADRAATHLVEFRVELGSADRARQARLGRHAHGHRARRRRVHPVARQLSASEG